MLNLEAAPSGQGTDLGAAMKGLHEIIRKRSLIILLSDLLAPLEELETQIGYLAAGRHDLAVFQILDPREIDFDFKKATHFRDKETGRDLYIDPDKARNDYLERFSVHQEAVRTMCAKHGVTHRLIPTDEPLEEVLFEFVTHRSA